MGELEKEVEEARLSSSSTATENEERKVAAVKQEYEEQLAALNEQISIMQNALNEEEAKTTKLHEEMEVNVKVGLASGCEIAEPGEGGAHAAAGGIAEPRSERRQRTNARDAEGEGGEGGGDRRPEPSHGGGAGGLARDSGASDGAGECDCVSSVSCRSFRRRRRHVRRQSSGALRC